MRADLASKRLGQRDWNDIRNYWVNFLHLFEFPSSLTDDYFIPESIDEVGLEIKRIEASSTIKEHYYIIDGIQQKTFNDSLILFYKGLNVLKSAQNDQDTGYKTWSTNNYYQSSYFLIKSLMCLLCISFSRTSDNVDLLIDLLPEYRKISKKEFVDRRERYETKILKVKQYKHWENWIILQKLLKITKNLKVPNVELFNLDPKNYAKHRNAIIYHNDKWLFDDLRQETIDDKFGIIDISKLDEIENTPEAVLWISYTLLHVLLRLYKDISDVSAHFKMEYDEIEKVLCTNNKYYDQYSTLNFL